MTLSIAVLFSGSGSNLEAIASRIQEGALQARIRVAVSDRGDSPGLSRAENLGLPARALEPADYADRHRHEESVIRLLREHGAEAAVLAGYMRLVSREFIRAFSGRVLNIHPSLLPSFKGVRGTKDAAEYGVRISGATVHFVDEQMDHGPVIIQAAVPADPGQDSDSLSSRIQALEHRIYPQAVQWLSQDRLHVRQGHVLLDDPPQPWTGTEQPPCLVSPGLEEGF